MSEKKLLGKDDILSCVDVTPQEVEVPEWGGVVLVRPMLGRDRDRLEQKSMSRKSERDIMCLKAWLICQLVVDDKGQRVFSDEDAEPINHKSSRAIERVYAHIVKVNWLGKTAIDEKVKN